MNDTVGSVIALVAVVAFLVFLPDVVRLYRRTKFEKKMKSLDTSDQFSLIYLKSYSVSDTASNMIVDVYACYSSGQVFLRFHEFHRGFERVLPFVEYRGSLPEDIAGELL